MPATQHAHCGMRAQLIKCAIAVVALTCGTMVHAATHLCQEEATTGTTPEQRFARLVCIRARAIQTAIGPLFDGRDLDIRIEFAGADDARDVAIAVVERFAHEAAGANAARRVG